jgi:hypothetical protein
MASKTLIDAALKLYKSLGGNTSKVLGTRSNINFLGKGKGPEMMLEMDINPEALGVMKQSDVVTEFDSAMGYLTSGKLNDMQANQLINNLSKANEFYNPPPGPSNVIDMATGTRNLDKEGLASLRLVADDFGYVSPEDLKRLRENKSLMSVPNKKELAGMEYELPSRGSAEETFKNTQNELRKELERLNEIDLPKDIDIRETTLPTGAGLEALKNVKNNNLIINDLVDKVYDMAGVAKTAQPVARGNARDFLNTIKDMEDPTFPGGTTLSDVMEVDDFKFATEGGGGGMGDPLLLVQKYFGPRVAAAVSKLEGRDQIELFANRLVKVKDAKGNTITDRGFDPTTVDPNDFEFKEGGRVGYRGGKLVGKALGMFKRQQALERGMGEGFAAAEQYGITGPMVSKLFRELAMDKSLVGQEKTQYMKLINEVLKNPEKYPDEILQIQKKLGLDIDVGMKGGGLAKILEV